jgi:chaperonin GroES
MDGIGAQRGRPQGEGRNARPWKPTPPSTLATSPKHFHWDYFAAKIGTHSRRVLAEREFPFSIKRFDETYFRPTHQGPLTMALRPLHDRVIIKRLEEEKMSAGGIVIPDTAAEKPIRGEVIAAGNGKILEDGKVRPIAVKKGDKVLFGKYSGTEVKVDGQELLVMREEDLLAVIE